MAEPGKLLFVTQKSENKLRQLVGAPNTTDYGKDGTADTPQQNIKRKDTNTDTEEVSQKHPFDVEIINKGTEANPQYYVRIFNSALPDSPNAGIVYAGLETINVAAAEISVSTQGRFYIDLIVSYDYESSPQYSARFEIRNAGTTSPVSNGSSWMQVIAEGQLPNIASRVTGDLEITGRWL